MNQLLIFSDASVHYYATAVYLRSVEENSVKVNLVFAKTRLVPVAKGRKKCKKSRLELMGVLIGVRAANFVAAELKLPLMERILWTDSQCVLHWLKTKKPLPVFIENRVREIRSQKDLSFRYITSDQNPSDCATRGLTVTDIKNSSLWWHGPIWLLKEQAMWPSWKLPELTSENLNPLQLEDKESQIIINVSTDKRNGSKDDLEIFLFGMKKLTSSLRKVLRISVFVMRFIKVKVWNNIERNIKDCLLVTVFQCLSDAEPVSTKEIQLWIRFIQQHCYEEVFTALKENKKHSLIHQLGLKKDEYGILRCYGRYTNADTSIEAKTPKLLPRKNCFTDLVIMEVHGRLIHAGVSHTLSCLRQEFWLPKGRAEVRRVLLQCVICKRYNGPCQVCHLGHVNEFQDQSHFSISGLGLLILKKVIQL